jgi:predicted phage terminase large subunit-like protein
MAPFQKEIFTLTEDEKIKNIVIEAFRGSAKTTILCTSYAIWSILGCQQRKFVLILGQTQSQARQYLANIKVELESNEILKADMGPFDEPDDDWRSDSIVIPKFGARITVASIEKSIRGLNHAGHRPDLIICDDLENLDSVKTIENRDKLFNWLVGDVIPMGSTHTRLIVVGTRLHEDSIIMRLKKAMAEGKMDGVARSYPLLDENNKIAWTGMYPTMQDIEALKRSIPSAIAWEREYRLRIIAPEDQIIRPEWIHNYDNLPDDGRTSDFRFAATGIDLAISEKESADYTAMVSAKVFGRGSELRVYILPNPVNERLNFPNTVERAKGVSRSLGNGSYTRLYIENVGYQQSLIDQLKNENVPAEEFKTLGNDKRSRLALTTNLIQSGRILFPREGANILVQQLTGFGKERHDDLADAFSIVINKIIAADTGPFFAEWNRNKHVIEPADISPRWTRFRAIHTAPREGYTACLWGALGSDGRVRIYREYYVTGRDSDEHAREIAARSKEEEGYLWTFMNRDAWGKPGFADSTWLVYDRHGVQGSLPAGDENPAMGLDAVHQRLRLGAGGEPNLLIYNGCLNLIHQLSSVVPDEKNRNDIDRNAEASLIRALQYMLQSIGNMNIPEPETFVQRKLRKLRNPDRYEGFDFHYRR